VSDRLGDSGDFSTGPGVFVRRLMAESAKSELLVQAEPGRMGEMGAVCSIDEIYHEFVCLFVILGHMRFHCE